MGTSVCMQLVTLWGRSMMVFSSLLTSRVFTRGFEVCSAARTLRSPVNNWPAQHKQNTASRDTKIDSTTTFFTLKHCDNITIDTNFTTATTWNRNHYDATTTTLPKQITTQHSHDTNITLLPTGQPYQHQHDDTQTTHDININMILTTSHSDNTSVTEAKLLALAGVLILLWWTPLQEVNTCCVSSPVSRLEDSVSLSSGKASTNLFIIRARSPSVLIRCRKQPSDSSALTSTCPHWRSSTHTSTTYTSGGQIRCDIAACSVQFIWVTLTTSPPAIDSPRPLQLRNGSRRVDRVWRRTRKQDERRCVTARSRIE